MAFSSSDNILICRDGIRSIDSVRISSTSPVPGYRKVYLRVSEHKRMLTVHRRHEHVVVRKKEGNGNAIASWRS